VEKCLFTHVQQVYLTHTEKLRLKKGLKAR